MSAITREDRADRLHQVAALTRQGMNSTDISVILRISRRTVTRYRNRAGISQPQHQPLTPEQHAIAGRLAADGCNAREIARTVGCDASTIRRHYPHAVWTSDQVIEYARLMRDAA